MTYHFNMKKKIQKKLFGKMQRTFNSLVLRPGSDFSEKVSLIPRHKFMFFLSVTTSN